MTETIEQYLWHRLCREVKAASPSGHVQLLLPYESICEILLIFYDFCGQKSFMLPFFPAPSPSSCVFLPFRILLLSALHVFVNFLWWRGPMALLRGGDREGEVKGFGFMAEMATLATK